MASLIDLTEAFASEDRPIGNLLDASVQLAQAIAATRMYAGYAALRDVSGNEPTPGAIDQYTDITTSEWAIIRPLFLLYLERETALQLEASRGLGIDPFGRSSSEIHQDIAQFELDLPHKAFSQPIISV